MMDINKDPTVSDLVAELKRTQRNYKLLDQWNDMLLEVRRAAAQASYFAATNPQVERLMDALERERLFCLKHGFTRDGGDD